MSRNPSLMLIIVCPVVAALLSGCGRTPEAPVYKNPSAPVEQRVQDLLGRIRRAKPLTNATTCGPRSPKPM